MSFPPWNNCGILPPFLGETPILKSNRSPYKTTLYEFVKAFGTTPERKLILKGLLNYRLDLKAVGINDGMQWVGGSLTENCEVLANRAPNDIDVVTFSHNTFTNEAEGEKLIRSRPELFDSNECKIKYQCDSYFIALSYFRFAKDIIKESNYWYGLLSHQRETYLWKGILEISLNEDEAQAKTYLDAEVISGE